MQLIHSLHSLLFLFATLLYTAAYASPLILADPIPVSGAGRWEGDQQEGMSFTFWASGDGGGHTVTLSAVSPLLPLPPVGTMPTMAGSSIPLGGVGAMIDAIGSARFQYFLSNDGGLGYLKVLDNSGSGELLASVPLISCLSQTSYFRDPGIYHPTHGSFVITGVPEPSTLILLCGGLILLVTAAALRANAVR